MALVHQCSLPTPGDRVTGPELGQVLLWLVEPDLSHSDSAADDEILDKEERNRRDRFTLPAARELYTQAHLALRSILAAVLRIAAAEVAFQRSPCRVCGGSHGRPELRPPPPPLRFSLSHTAGLVAVALARTAVGVDVEATAHGQLNDTVARQFHPWEQATLATVPAPCRSSLLLQAWVRKEAYLKGIGTGLTPGATRVLTGLNDTLRAHSPQGWQIQDLRCGQGHVGAVALATTT